MCFEILRQIAEIDIQSERNKMLEFLKFLQKGSEKGYCRICGNFDSLTDDHIPPKNCGNIMPVFVENFGGEKIISQNGAKFKTICGSCNNAILGSGPDKELARIQKEFRKNYSKLIINPNSSINLRINPKLLSKSILGHLLALFVGDNPKQNLKMKPKHSEFSLELRDFVLNGKIPENIEIYYWFYPYEEIKINIFFGYIPDIQHSNMKVMGSLFKFEPFAFLIVNKHGSNAKLQHGKLNLSSDEQVIKINLRQKIRKDYPERPGSKGVVILNSSSDIRIKNKNS